MPQPTTTGGGLMGYPSTVDNGQIAPTLLYEADLASGASITLSANLARLNAITISAPVTITGFRTNFGAGGNGHCDFGIYDNSGNLLAHTGLVVTATGLVTGNLGANLPVSPGVYWLAFWIDNATDTVKTASSVTGLAPYKGGTYSGGGGLPSNTSSFTGYANVSNRVVMNVLLLGGFS